MPTVETLIADLHSPNPDMRVAAADGLGQYAAFHEDTSMLPSAIPHLVKAFRTDPARGVRLAAAYSLGAIGDARAVPDLIDGLHASASDQGLQLVIAKALGKTRDPLAVTALIEVLQSGISRCVSAAAARALERIGTPEALAAVETWRSEQRAHHE